MPVGVLTNFGGNTLDPIRQPAALRVDEARRQKIPCGGVSQSRRGKARTNTVGQPTIEFLQTGAHPLGTFELPLRSTRVDRERLGSRRP